MCKCLAICRNFAKVFYTIHSNLASDSQKAQTGLEKATGTIKRELGKNLTMYKIPDLTFIKDESIDTVIKLMKCFVIWSVKTKITFLSIMAGILPYNRIKRRDFNERVTVYLGANMGDSPSFKEATIALGLFGLLEMDIP